MNEIFQGQGTNTSQWSWFMLHWMQGNQIFEATIVNGLPRPIVFWKTHPCKWNWILEYPVKVFGRAKTMHLEAVFRWNQHS